MSRSASPRSKLPSVVAVLSVSVLGFLVFGALHALTPRHSPSGDADEGHVTLSLSLQPGSLATYVGYVVKAANGAALTTGSMPVKDPRAPLSVELALPSGKGDTVTFFSSTNENGRKADWHLGARTFDVVPGQNARVNLGTVAVGSSTPSGTGNRPAEGPTGASPGGVTASGSALTAMTTGTPTASNCQACELAAEQGKCDPGFLSGRADDPTSWGCGTLATPVERTACAALLHCLNVADCAQGGNLFLGCFCGSANIQNCVAGSGVSGDCVPQYEAAAASAGGPPLGSPVAVLARYLIAMGTNPRSPVGLADNIRECAIQAHCNSCDGL
jgi:hypothetical protein